MSVHDDLLALCASIYVAGEPLTYNRLRAWYGGGSKRDIGRAIRSWKSANLQPVTQPNLPLFTKQHRLAKIIERQRQVISQQAEEIRVLTEETVVLANMVRNYRGYSDDIDDLMAEEIKQRSPE